MESDHESDDVSLGTQPRKARELPPLSPRKEATVQHVKQRRKPKRRKNLNGNDKSSETNEKPSSNFSNNDNSNIKKIKPALPPRSPRKNLPSPLVIDAVYNNDVNEVGSINSIKKDDTAKLKSENSAVDLDVTSSSSFTNNKSKAKNEQNSSSSHSVKHSPSKNISSTYYSNDTLCFDLTDLDDDITEINADNHPVISTNLIDNLPSQSQETKNCFIEQKDTFKSVNKKSWMTISEQKNVVQNDFSETKPVKSALQLALSSHKLFKTLTLFCHGLLAGISLWQIIITYQLDNSGNAIQDFLDHYSSLAQPFHAVFSFLLVLCTVSVFDRYDFARLNLQLLKEILTFRDGAFVIMVYFITLILHFSIINIDDKLNLHQINNTRWIYLDSESQIKDQIAGWKISNLCRCLGAIIGWVMISLYPYIDLLSNNLTLTSKSSVKDRKTNIITIA